MRLAFADAGAAHGHGRRGRRPLQLETSKPWCLPSLMGLVFGIQGCVWLVEIVRQHQFGGQPIASAGQAEAEAGFDVD
jgi:hypothetical protein